MPGSRQEPPGAPTRARGTTYQGAQLARRLEPLQALDQGDGLPPGKPVLMPLKKYFSGNMRPGRDLLQALDQGAPDAPGSRQGAARARRAAWVMCVPGRDQGAP